MVIDPACGTGGFLTEALKHKWNVLDAKARKYQWPESDLGEEKRDTALKTINGLEKDSFLAKVAKAYMAILGDGKSGIFCEDSLEPSNKWSPRTQQYIALNKFDVVLANPPFGKEIKVKGEAKLAQYDLAHTSPQSDSENRVLLAEQNPQVLFVERCIQLAKEGGIIGIILPETYFHASSTKNVRDVILAHNIIAIIDLPHNTFRPFNNAKCIAIIFQKDCSQSDDILMVDAKEMGHNHNGKPIYRLNADNSVSTQLWDDISCASQEIAERTTGERTTGKYTFHVAGEDVKKSDILIPRYYHGTNDISFRECAYKDVSWITLEELITDGIVWQSAGHGSPPAQMKGLGQYPYVRVKDIINWEVYRDPTAFIPQTTFERLYNRLKLHENDILYVSRGSYRIGDCAIIGPDDTEIVITREIHVIRVLANAIGLTPYYLLYLLSTSIVKQQTESRIFLETTLPNIADRYLSIRLPWHKDEQVRADISQQVHRIVSARWQGMANMRTLIKKQF